MKSHRKNYVVNYYCKKKRILLTKCLQKFLVTTLNIAINNSICLTHTVSFQIFRSLSFMSFFLSKVVLENYFVKSQHSVLKLCHLTFFFWKKSFKRSFKFFLKIREITTFTSRLSSFNNFFPTSCIYWRPCLKRDYENGKWTKNLKT